MSDMVKISREFYDVLQNEAFENKMLYNAIFDNASLTWNDEGLKVSDDINPILKALYPDEYETKLRKLKREKEAKEKANGAD